MPEPIKGKVAQIFSEYELALNIGSDQGVVKGMIFAIYSSPVPLFDPDTNEEIGQVTMETNRVEVYTVDKRYSLAHSFFSATQISTPFPTLFKPYSRKKLNINRDDLMESEAIIKVGSIAQQIIDEK